MNDTLQGLRPQLEQQVAAALTSMSMNNRGTFPPFRIPTAAQSLVGGMFAGTSDDATAAARALGTALGQAGMGLPALLVAQGAALDLIARAADPASGAVAFASGYFGAVIESLVVADSAELERQRVEMERAYLNTVSEQREQEERLRSAIRELSTPIVPVYEGILVLPLVGSVDSRRAAEITERLLEAISASQAEIVIIDITGVPLIDTSTANHLLMTTRAASLLGSQVVLVGIGAEVAQTIVHIGIELRGLITLANLQAGIAYALERMGLSIQPLAGARKAA